MTDKKIGLEQPRGRGRPRAFDVERALDIAMEMFHRCGYDNVGVAELSEAIGVKPPSLYAAFGSKCGLYERALERYVNKHSFVSEVLATDEPLAMQIERLLSKAANIYTQPDCPAGCMVLEGVRHCLDPKAASLTADLRRKNRKMLRAHIARSYPEGAGELVDFVLTAMHGLSASARDGVGRKRLQRSARIAAEGFRAHLGSIQKSNRSTGHGFRP